MHTLSEAETFIRTLSHTGTRTDEHRCPAGKDTPTHKYAQFREVYTHSTATQTYTLGAHQEGHHIHMHSHVHPV